MTERSRDYHDYVFRNGQLVAEFEEMYRHSEGVPWHQDQQDDWIDVRLTVEMLKDVCPFDEIHDLGCGLGYYLAIAAQRMGTADGKFFGYDVSETACRNAVDLFPSFTFRQMDLTREPTATTANGTTGPNRLFVIRGTLWYVFPKLAHVVSNIRSLLSKEDKVLVVQNFPPLSGPFIGKDVIPDHHAIIRHFGPHFSIRRSIWYEDTVKATNDNWFIGLFSVADQR